MTHVHLIGIGGSGLSAIAWVLVERGFTVSGSDRVISPLAKSLQAAGVRVDIGHRPEYIQGADLVIRSSAVPDNNPEVQAAQAAGIPVLKRADFLGQLMADQIGIAVAGTHGKTTTTAMIAWMLTSLGQDPSFIVGGVLQNLGKNARAGQGPAFVIEADEYDGMFLGLQPHMVVITNVEHDHPDCYPTPEDYRQAFLNFVSKLSDQGILFACADDPGALEISQFAQEAGLRSFTYGVHSPADYQAQDLTPVPGQGFSFSVSRGSSSALTHLQVPGIHNVQNALAALAVADQLGLNLSDAALALGSYKGTGRRFEVRGEINGITLVDDYAHHPTEIEATLFAARQRFPARQLWVLWQPHTYSRTMTLFDQYTRAFHLADRVVVTEVFAAREPACGFSAEQVALAIPEIPVVFIPDLDAVSRYLFQHLTPGDVLLVLSAGDADQVNTRLLAGLQGDGDLNG